MLLLATSVSNEWAIFVNEPEKHPNQTLAQKSKQAAVGTLAKLESQSTCFQIWVKKQIGNCLNLNNGGNPDWNPNFATSPHFKRNPEAEQSRIGERKVWRLDPELRSRPKFLNLNWFRRGGAGINNENIKNQTIQFYMFIIMPTTKVNSSYAESAWQNNVNTCNHPGVLLGLRTETSLPLSSFDHVHLWTLGFPQTQYSWWNCGHYKNRVKAPLKPCKAKLHSPVKLSQTPAVLLPLKTMAKCFPLSQCEQGQAFH